MRTLDFNLNDNKNGGKITGFSYSRSLNELVSSWSATIAGGHFKAGDFINFAGAMTDGIISNAYKDSSGLWHLEGRDAGVKLMRSTPEISEIPNGNAHTVINYIANFCDISLIMTGNGLTGFNVKSCISGSTCAEVILELAMLSGNIAFIDNSGRLNVTAPSKTNPSFNIILDDSGSNIDLDGYATQVLVNLTRRKWQTEEEKSSSPQHTYYTGRTPSTSLERVTYSGTFEGGSYSITKLMPLDVIESLECVLTKENVTLTVRENHSFDYKTKIIWRDNQEYVLFAFVETGYTLTRTTQGSYQAKIKKDDGTTELDTLNFTETTTETMTRDFSIIYDDINLPEDWQGQLNMIETETITRATVRTGGKEPEQNMPAYAPDFDERITRTYTRELDGRGIICNELDETYEARQVGSIAPVTLNGQPVPHFMFDSNLAIQTHSTPQWVLVKNYKTYIDRYNKDGDCVISTQSDYSDDGAEWLTAHALHDTGDDDINEYQKAYAKFSQHSQGLNVTAGSSSINSSWQFVELQGRMKNTSSDDEDGQVLGNISDWYNNGEFIPAAVCPFYDSNSCNIYKLNFQIYGDKCMKNKGTLGWQSCTRANAALELARQQDIAQVETVIIGTASAKTTGTKAGYQRDIYIDDLLSNEQAQLIANTIARNILNVKSTKGIRKTVIVPYSPNIHLNGSIVEVSHDWENLQTTVSYLTSGDIPEFMISQSVAGIAAFVSVRENSRSNIPKYGTVISCSNGYALVRINNSAYNCTTRLKNLGQGDIVLVSFPAGNKLRGQVIARL